MDGNGMASLQLGSFNQPSASFVFFVARIKWSNQMVLSISLDVVIFPNVPMTLLKSVLMNDTFVGYQAASKHNLRSAECLCYKWFPSVQDIIFNHRKIVGYTLLGFLRMRYQSQHMMTLNRWLNHNSKKFLRLPDIYFYNKKVRQLARVRRVIRIKFLCNIFPLIIIVKTYESFSTLCNNAPYQVYHSDVFLQVSVDVFMTPQLRLKRSNVNFWKNTVAEEKCQINSSWWLYRLLDRFTC